MTNLRRQGQKFFLGGVGCVELGEERRGEEKRGRSFAESVGLPGIRGLSVCGAVPQLIRPDSPPVRRESSLRWATFSRFSAFKDYASKPVNHRSVTRRVIPTLAAVELAHT
ncbi:hypothetical protein CIHG_06657 [Coccidioides immitis H538.4]|uniref:Uncharacterized protein n=2 Tax=Coccidioides immitis TaxID=5501 RepID=A0A0J8RW96_COCIT|nr:hypothetical protein CIRG_01549 [Coccidioides immitis RMSCC 2394]KMU88856.1 hypothetical protein CIHG_06657 [Coccidioides immitis H538.4]